MLEALQVFDKLLRVESIESQSQLVAPILAGPAGPVRPIVQKTHELGRGIH
jgi:hypothetical protein